MEIEVDYLRVGTPGSPRGEHLARGGSCPNNQVANLGCCILVSAGIVLGLAYGGVFDSSSDQASSSPEAGGNSTALNVTALNRSSSGADAVESAGSFLWGVATRVASAVSNLF